MNLKALVLLHLAAAVVARPMISKATGEDEVALISTFREKVPPDFETIPPTKYSTKSPTPSPTAPLPPQPKVVTLGDSYSSGTGIHRDDSDYDEPDGGNPSLNGVSYKLTVRSDNECWRETDTTPGPMYASEEGYQSIFLACKGAEAANIENQFDYLNALYPADKQNNWQGSTILLTTGGNDIRTNDGQDWPELLEHCIFNIWGCHKRNDNQVSNWNAIQNDLTAIFDKIASEASGAKIRILGYPKMMQRDPGCGSVTGISKNEADWIDDQVVVLNNKVSAAVAAAKSANPAVDMSFVNVYGYLTVGACGDGPSNRHVHDKRLSNNFPWGTSDSSFHPSQLGYNAYFQALKDSL